MNLSVLKADWTYDSNKHVDLMFEGKLLLSKQNESLSASMLERNMGPQTAVISDDRWKVDT